LSEDVETPEAEKLGYSSAADAERQAASKVCDEIEAEIEKSSNAVNAEIYAFLERMDVLLEPKTHCCYCTPGLEFQGRHPATDGHPLHTQFPNCRCKPENYVMPESLATTPPAP